MSAAALILSACTQTTPKVGIISGEVVRTNKPIILSNTVDNGETSGPEAFSESAFGVSASPLVATGVRLPRGGGYEKIGASYVVAGRRYTPTRTPKRVQTGVASWYGKAFHGRKTANGEIYDMNHLTAAHKTMPLPSYARVTNQKNGHSVIVRVNDRGPFSNNRVIDLSKRAAEILDYTNSGTANVRVEYIGPAPLHGQDDQYLMSSIRGVRGKIAQALPGVSSNIITARASQSNAAEVTHQTAYASWRIDTAFDRFKTERASLLWKRINAVD